MRLRLVRLTVQFPGSRIMTFITMRLVHMKLNDNVIKLFVFCWLAVQLQIEEITRRLRTGELGIPANPGDRSVSIALLLLSIGGANFSYCVMASRVKPDDTILVYYVMLLSHPHSPLSETE